MSTDSPQNPSDGFLLIIRGTHWNNPLPPAGFQKSMAEAQGVVCNEKEEVA